MILEIFYILGIAFIILIISELSIRFLVACKHKTFRNNKDIFEVIRNPVGGVDWRIFTISGKVNKKKSKRLFRLSAQADQMGFSDDKLQEIMAKASQTDIESIKNVYCGANSFEHYSYRPFVGFGAQPNQKLSYTEINNLGVQASSTEYRKPINTKRVLILGGSVAFGFGCSSKENNITFKMEKILNEMQKRKDPNIKWEVINFAFVGSQTISELNKVLIYASLFSPDYIVQLSGFNDLYCFLNENRMKLFTHLMYERVMWQLSSTEFEIFLSGLAQRFYIARVALKLTSNLQLSDHSSGISDKIYTVW